MGDSIFFGFDKNKYKELCVKLKESKYFLSKYDDCDNSFIFNSTLIVKLDGEEGKGCIDFGFNSQKEIFNAITDILKVYTTEYYGLLSDLADKEVIEKEIKGGVK